MNPQAETYQAPNQPQTGLDIPRPLDQEAANIAIAPGFATPQDTSSRLLVPPSLRPGIDHNAPSDPAINPTTQTFVVINPAVTVPLSGKNSTPRFRNLVKDLSETCASLLAPSAGPNVPLLTSSSPEETIVNALHTWNTLKDTGRPTSYTNSFLPQELATNEDDMIKVNLVFE